MKNGPFAPPGFWPARCGRTASCTCRPSAKTWRRWTLPSRLRGETVVKSKKGCGRRDVWLLCWLFVFMFRIGLMYNWQTLRFVWWFVFDKWWYVEDMCKIDESIYTCEWVWPTRHVFLFPGAMLPSCLKPWNCRSGDFFGEIWLAMAVWTSNNLLNCSKWPGNLSLIQFAFLRPNLPKLGMSCPMAPLQDVSLKCLTPVLYEVSVFFFFQYGGRTSSRDKDGGWC